MDVPRPDRAGDAAYLAAEADVPEERALSVARPEGSILLYRWNGQIKAFRNRCPHVGTPLDLIPGRVFTEDRSHLICATHGALFDPATGLCIKGPCRGQPLRPVAIRLSEGQIWLAGTD